MTALSQMPPNSPTTSRACLLCGTVPIDRIDEIAGLCPCCGLLHNLAAKPLAYAEEGGQHVPDGNKSRWRLENGRRRLAIVMPYVKGHQSFIDIGCGSGETLQAAASLFPHVLGFDTNRPLIAHIRDHLGLAAIEGHFDASQMERILPAGKKVFALSHVLEHLAQPLVLLAQIKEAMGIGDLLYIEVPLHTGQSFQTQGYGWSLWNDEHLALYAPETLTFAARKLGFALLCQGARIFARGSHSGKTRLRLLRRQPLNFLKALWEKPKSLSMADMIISDYGFVVLEKPSGEAGS